MDSPAIANVGKNSSCDRPGRSDSSLFSLQHNVTIRCKIAQKSTRP